jgi:hypothetical protein
MRSRLGTPVLLPACHAGAGLLSGVSSPGPSGLVRQIGVLVIGGGAVGLSVAAAVARRQLGGCAARCTHIHWRAYRDGADRAV